VTNEKASESQIGFNKLSSISLLRIVSKHQTDRKVILLLNYSSWIRKTC